MGRPSIPIVNGRKKCTRCKEDLPLDAFRPNPRSTTGGLLSRCTSCLLWIQLERKYEITQKEYERMEDEQGGVCFLCSGVNKDGRPLFVDHDHRTGKVRKLLCLSCNAKISYLEDESWFRRAAEYLGWS